MSIRDRIEESQFLYSNGRREGALLSLLIAVAATSRRRYPKEEFRDSDAFSKFIQDETPVITRGVIKNLTVRVPGGKSKKHPEAKMPIGECFYHFVRNNLAHEATLPENVEFLQTEQGALTIEVTDDKIRLSDSFMVGLANAVVFAPENFDVFPDNSEIPPDVVAWQLFGKLRAKSNDYMEDRQKRIDDLAARISSDTHFAQ